MGWARIDDRWHDHPKVIAAGLEAAGLWAMCLTWAHQARRTSPTPGVVPDRVIQRLAGGRAKKLTEHLSRVGLFDDRTDAGWPIHDFHQYLPRYDPDQAAEAGRKGAKTRWGSGHNKNGKPPYEPSNGLPPEPPYDPDSEPPC